MTPTRYKELAYQQDGPKLWRFYDVTSSTPAAVGAQYKTKAELLADLERYARVFGCEGAGSPSQADMGLAPPGDDDLARLLTFMQQRYGKLHDALSDCIEGGRLREGDLPDDYQALVKYLVDCNEADHLCTEALKKLTPQAEGIQPQDYTVVALFIGRHPGIRVIDIEHVRACSANQAGQMLKQQYEGTERGPDRVEQVEVVAVFPGKHEDSFDHSKV